MSTQAKLKAATVHGVVCLDKPGGPTSFDVVAQVRRAYRTKAVGHAGTLDPMATGVLVVMLGEATKLSEHLTAQNKEYIAQISFGRSTDTLDATGTTVEARELGPNAVSLSALEQAVDQERQRQWQVPPGHSAIKVAGQRAYTLARRGEQVELAPRRVNVASLSIRAFDDTSLTLHMSVSKGYYVRSLVRDLCAQLGVPGCMSALRRTASGNYRIEGSAPWPTPPDSELPAPMSVSEAVRLALPSVTLTEEGVSRARQGKRLAAQHFEMAPAPSVTAWLDNQNKLVALGEAVPASLEYEAYFRVLRGFTDNLV